MRGHMVIQCEKCRTKFNFDEALLKIEGSTVRCSCCKHVFVVYPSEQIGTKEKKKVTVKAEEQRPPEEINEAGLEEKTDLDAIFEEESMEDMAAIEADYQTKGGEFEEESDTQEPAIEDKEKDSEKKPGAETETVSTVGEKKKSNKSYRLLIIFVIILGLLGLGYAVSYRYPEIVSDFLNLLAKKPTGKQKSADMGAGRLEILTVSGSFVDSEHSGHLFVIRGKVRNNYPGSRRFILVKGSILDDKGQVVKEKSAYAGNAFEATDLMTLTSEQINQRMKNPHGFNQKNVDVKPGTAIDFVIVFENLPENLSEFTVGAVSSSPGSS